MTRTQVEHMLRHMQDKHPTTILYLWHLGCSIFDTPIFLDAEFGNRDLFSKKSVKESVT